MKRVRKQPAPLPISPSRFRFVRVRQDPLLAILQRVGLATFLLLVVTFITYFGRKGYVDTQHPNQLLTFIDALYYSTVTITTTGYGDIVPVTQASRLITTVVVTPIRILFIVLLVGTTLQVLAEQSRFQFRLRKWQRDLSDHVLICGFGVKGQAAVDYIHEHDEDLEVVVIDESDDALEEANRLGITGIAGKAYDTSTLEAARAQTADRVIVSLNSDEQAILTVLRIRELNKDCTIIASCKEESNRDLLESSGASEVVVSSSSAGRILGMAAETPDAARVVNDLLTFGDGLDINERHVTVDGEPLERGHTETAIAVIRGEKVHRPGDEDCSTLRRGDQVIYIDQPEIKTKSASEEPDDSKV